MTLEVGKKAPNFTLPNQNGNSVRLDDFTGKWLLVYFYPRDDTPGCTVEAKDFTCLLYTSPSPRDLSTSRMPSSA